MRANIGDNGAVFEAMHGRAPKYKGQNKVNPTALILSGMLMLRYLNLTEKTDRLEITVAAVIEEGKDVTYDMKPDRNDPTAVGTNVIIAKMQAGVPHAGWAWIRVTDGDVRQGTIRD